MTRKNKVKSKNEDESSDDVIFKMEQPLASVRLIAEEEREKEEEEKERKGSKLEMESKQQLEPVKHEEKIDLRRKSILIQAMDDDSMNFRICVADTCKFSGWLFPGEKCAYCGCSTIYFGSDQNVWKGPIDGMGALHFQSSYTRWKLQWNQEKAKMRLDWAIHTNEGKAFIYKGGMYYDAKDKNFKSLPSS